MTMIRYWGLPARLRKLLLDVRVGFRDWSGSLLRIGGLGGTFRGLGSSRALLISIIMLIVWLWRRRLLPATPPSCTSCRL